jgi:hypothetical protein
VGLDGQLDFLVDLVERVALDDGREVLDEVVLQSGRKWQKIDHTGDMTFTPPMACTIYTLRSSICYGTTHFKKCKQLFEYQHLLLLRDILVVKVKIYI